VRQRSTDALAGAIAASGVVLLVVTVAGRKLGDFDLPLNLATGRLVLQTGRVPHIDDFSFLHGTVRYVELVSVTLLALAMRAGGALGVQLVGGLSAAGIAAALWLQSRRFGPIAMVATTLSIAAASSFLVVRSSALSFPLLACVLLALDLHRRHPQARRGPQALAAYVVLSLVWANTHGSVPMGLAIGAAYLGYRVACRVARGRWGALLPSTDASDVPAVAVALGMAIAAACLSTAGPSLLLGPLRWGGRLDVLATFSEWARPTASFLVDREPVVAVALGVAVLAGIAGRDAETGERTPALYDLLLLLLALGCAATAVRLLPLSAILVAPWIARRLGRHVRPTPAIRLACAGGALLASIAVWLSPLPRGVGFDTSHLPEGAARWAEAHHPEGHLWNSPPFGGYLVYRLYPPTQVLMDGRSGLAYDLSDVAAVDASERDPGAFATLVRTRDLQWAVTRAFEGSPSGIPLAASHDWTMVFQDDVSAVYVRRGGVDDRLAEGGYRILRHLASPEQVLSLALQGGPTAASLAHDGALAAADDPRSSRAAFLDACGAIALRDEAALEAASARLAAIAPGHPALGILAAAWDTARSPGKD
jgi:hypothetical protein